MKSTKSGAGEQFLLLDCRAKAPTCSYKQGLIRTYKLIVRGPLNRGLLETPMALATPTASTENSHRCCGLFISPVVAFVEWRGNLMTTELILLIM